MYEKYYCFRKIINNIFQAISSRTINWKNIQPIWKTSSIKESECSERDLELNKWKEVPQHFTLLEAGFAAVSAMQTEKWKCQYCNSASMDR